MTQPVTSENHAGKQTTNGIPERFLAVATVAVVLMSVAQAAYAAWSQDWTYDEEVHLLWTERLLTTGETERESHPRFNSRTPVVIPNVVAWKAAQAFPVEQPEHLRLAARLPTVGLLAVLLAAVFVATRAFVMPRAAAYIATMLAALDPNLIAHGSLVTVDLAYALAVWLSLVAGLRFSTRPGLRTGMALGAAVGFAFISKFTAVLLLLGLLPIVVWVYRCRRVAGAHRIVVGGAFAAVACWMVVCAAYLFLDVGAPLGAVAFKSDVLRPVAAALPCVRLPVPVAFATGLDASLATERQAWNVYLLGQIHPEGVWYYFPVVWALKTPLVVMVAVLVGLAAALTSSTLRGNKFVALLSLNFFLNLAYFSLFFHTQLGYRYVLMCVSMAASVAATGLTTRFRFSPSIVLVILMIGGLGEVLPYIGNPLAFTNAAVWPKREVFRLLADSNVDWGQNRGKVERWQAEGRLPPGVVDPVHILPGYNIMSLNAVAGIRDFEQHRWLREHSSPVGHAGHTYLWFNVSESLFERFMTEARGLQPTADASAVCSGPEPFEIMRAGTRHDFIWDGPPDPYKFWITCIESVKGTSLGLRVFRGGLTVGRYRLGKPCVGENVGPGGLVWFRLAPGLHAVCADEIPNRRAFLPYNLEARWIVRGHRAQLKSFRGGNEPPVRTSAP